MNRHPFLRPCPEAEKQQQQQQHRHPRRQTTRHSSSRLTRRHPSMRGFLGLLVLLLVVASPARSQGWKATLVRVLEKTLLRQTTTNAPNNSGTTTQDSPVLSSTPSAAVTTDNEPSLADQYIRHRIPCGLMMAIDSSGSSSEEAEYDDVLPLATLAVATTTTASNEEDNSDHEEVPSTLHASVVEQRYPQLLQYVRDGSSGTHQRFLPAGTFRLRLDESTIEASPELRIVDDRHHHLPNGDATIELVLGTAFWRDHGAKFGEDEVYLFPTPQRGRHEETSPPPPPLMVPYLAMRSRPSFGTDDL